MKRYLLILGTVWCATVSTAFAQAQEYTVHGRVNVQNGWAKLSYFPDNAHLHEDSARIINGGFTLHGPLPEPTRGGLSITGSSEVVEFYLDHSTIYFANDSITGSPAQAEYEWLTTTLKPLKIEELHTTDKAALAAINDKRFLILQDFAKQHPNSYVLLHELLETYAYDLTAAQFTSINNIISDSLKHSFVGVLYEKAVISAQNTDLGKVAPAIAMKDANGKPWALSNFKGRYLLIDFWASWCPPCRIQNRAVVKLYQQYKAKGFDVVGFSLDFDNKAWRQAIIHDKLPYTQLSDLKGWDSPVRKAYGLYLLPKNFLLDSKGVIIAKDLDGEALEKKLAELL
jgi:peroxiredoxin